MRLLLSATGMENSWWIKDLEFASIMVQKLNLILITSPELAEFRRRLKSLETRVSLSNTFFRDLQLKFLVAGWTGAIYYSISVLVSQCCCRVCALPFGASI